MNIPAALIVLAFSAAIACGQNTPAKNADKEWEKVRALTMPAALPKDSGTNKTPTKLQEEAAQRALRWREAAQAAKAFHLEFPNSFYAPEAKKTSALGGLLGVTDGDPAQESLALQAADAYRSDKSNPIKSRFEVAVLAERMRARGASSGKIHSNNTRELTKIAQKLHLEFGDIPEVFAFYMSVARSADMTDAPALATKVLQSSSTAADHAKSEAQSVIARHALLAKPLRWKLTELGQTTPLDLSEQKGKPTVIYLWSYREDAVPFPGLVAHKGAIGGGTRIVYLTLNATAEQVKEAKAKAPVPGVHCYEPRGAIGPTAEQFHARHFPYVYVLNKAGELIGYGPLAELPNLLALANK